jgi:hypothetical protein
MNGLFVASGFTRAGERVFGAFTLNRTRRLNALS